MSESIHKGDTLHMVFTVISAGVAIDATAAVVEARAVIGSIVVDGTIDLTDALTGVVRVIFDATLNVIGQWKTQVRITIDDDTITDFDELIEVKSSLWS